MKNATLRWTATLGLLLGALLTAATWARGLAPDEAPSPRRKPVDAPRPEPAATGYSGSADPVPAEAGTASASSTLPDEVLPIPPRRSARDEGYREVKEGVGEGSLTGQVVSSGGPLPGVGVRVEWVMAYAPDRGEVQRLKRGGARRDRDGAWWSRSVAVTDDGGYFRFEGLPAVPLKLSVGSSVLKTQIGEYATLRVEPR